MLGALDSLTLVLLFLSIFATGSIVVTTGIKPGSNIGNALVSAMYGRSSELGLGKTSIEKNGFFRALPELPNPTPPDPNSGNLVLFFSGHQNSRFESHLRREIY